MSPIWSYALAVLGITGLFIAANRPKVGWWFNIAAQAAWVAYAVATRQWGFLLTAVGYAIVYARLLRKAYRPPRQEMDPPSGPVFIPVKYTGHKPDLERP